MPGLGVSAKVLNGQKEYLLISVVNEYREWKDNIIIFHLQMGELFRISFRIRHYYYGDVHSCTYVRLIFNMT